MSFLRIGRRSTQKTLLFKMLHFVINLLLCTVFELYKKCVLNTMFLFNQCFVFISNKKTETLKPRIVCEEIVSYFPPPQDIWFSSITMNPKGRFHQLLMRNILLGSFSLRHPACFTASPEALQKALTQKAGLRTLRTATWSTLWSGSLPASSTRCAQRAE